MEATSPTARALLALQVLQDSPGVSAERLARRLGVTDRAVRRCVRVLRDAGIPVESTPGRYGGYRLGRGTRLPPLMLSPAEALGLVMAVVESRPGAADAADPVGSALGKIIRVLPTALAPSVAAFRRVTTAQTGSAWAQPDPETTAALLRAAEARLRVRLTYRMHKEREMDVDPWAVTVWRGRWYLLGWSHAVSQRRVFRVDRISAVEPLADRFTPPADLDATAAIEEQMSSGWEYDVEVVIDAPVDAVARCLPRHVGRLEPTEDGRTRLVGTTGDPDYIARHLTALPAPYTIVSPPQLRDAARKMGERLIRAGSE